MGNKIITEKDFWTCTGGLMSTQFQSGQSKAKKKIGEKYITKMDTATVSFADFSCKKLMLVMAILTALVAVLTVATGGAALIAIGAIAGAAGAAFGAVVGSLLCGQMVAKVRKWEVGKENFKILGIPTITGDHKMHCPIFGDEITFDPEIKTWGQALAKGAANLIGGIMEGMMAGALIGMGGGLLGGGRAALTSGGFRGLGQAGLNLLKTAPSNIMSNFGQGLFNGAGFKLVDGATNWLNTYGDTGEASAGDFTKGVKESAFGDVAAINNILTTGGTTQDWVASLMLLTPAGKKGGNNHNNSHISSPDAPHGNKPHGDADGGSNKKADGEEGNSTKPKSHAPDTPNAKRGDGEAFADGGDAPIKPKKTKLEAGTPEHKAQRWKDYQEKCKAAGKEPLSYDEWSRRYDASMNNPRKGNKAADEYHKEIGWGEREVPMKLDENGNAIKSESGTPERRLDIADVVDKKAVEVKDYSSRNVPYSDKIKKEVEFDKKLAEQGWDIEWKFKDKGPSKALEDALNTPPPIKIKR